MLKRQPAVEPHIGVGPFLLVGLGEALEVEIVAVGWAEARPGMGKVRRSLAQHQHAELFLLRPVEADRHVVLRALLGQEHLHDLGQRVLGQQEVMREEAFIGGRVSKVGIDREQIVQKGRAGPPMADDEDRRLVERERLGGAAVFRFRDPIEHRVPRHPKEQRQHVGEAIEREAVVPALEQLQQRAEPHAEPEIDQAPAVAVDGERRHARLRPGSPAEAFMLLGGLFLVIRHARSNPQKRQQGGFAKRVSRDLRRKEDFCCWSRSLARGGGAVSPAAPPSPPRQAPSGRRASAKT